MIRDKNNDTNNIIWSVIKVSKLLIYEDTYKLIEEKFFVTEKSNGRMDDINIITSIIIDTTDNNTLIKYCLIYTSYSIWNTTLMAIIAQ